MLLQDAFKHIADFLAAKKVGSITVNCCMGGISAIQINETVRDAAERPYNSKAVKQDYEKSVRRRASAIDCVTVTPSTSYSRSG